MLPHSLLHAGRCDMLDAKTFTSHRPSSLRAARLPGLAAGLLPAAGSFGWCWVLAHKRAAVGCQ